jgi:hypothetical protein
MSRPRPLWYDRTGNPISQDAWAELHTDLGYIVVARTDAGDGVEVSTVWIGLDQGFWREGPPLIFETMIFGGDHDGQQWRYPNEVAALAGHDQAVALARETVEK